MLASIGGAPPVTGSELFLHFSIRLQSCPCQGRRRPLADSMSHAAGRLLGVCLGRASCCDSPSMHFWRQSSRHPLPMQPPSSVVVLWHVEGGSPLRHRLRRHAPPMRGRDGSFLLDGS